jgi:hypothetical protein
MQIFNAKAVGMHRLEKINVSYVCKYPASITDTSILVQSLRTGNYTQCVFKDRRSGALKTKVHVQSNELDLQSNSLIRRVKLDGLLCIDFVVPIR